MPKESIHFKIARMVANLYHYDSKVFYEFTWSSILTDMFFYVPSPHFPKLGNILHALEAKSFSLTKDILNKTTEKELKIQLLGLLFHLATDDLWHRDIDTAAKKLANSSGENLSETYFHRFTESCMQKFFMNPEEEKEFTRFLTKPPTTEFSQKYNKAIALLLHGRTKIPSSFQLHVGTLLHSKILTLLQRKNMPSMQYNMPFAKQMLPLISLFPPTNANLTFFLSKYSHIPEIQRIFSIKTFQKRFNLLVTSFHELLKQF